MNKYVNIVTESINLNENIRIDFSPDVTIDELNIQNEAKYHKQLKDYEQKLNNSVWERLKKYFGFGEKHDPRRLMDAIDACTQMYYKAATKVFNVKSFIVEYVGEDKVGDSVKQTLAKAFSTYCVDYYTFEYYKSLCQKYESYSGPPSGGKLPYDRLCEVNKFAIHLYNDMSKNYEILQNIANKYSYGDFSVRMK